MMTEKDVGVCLAAVFEFYGKQSANPKEAIKLWHRYLCDEPKEIVQAAFDKWIATEKFAPKPAEILELIEKAKSEIFSRYLTGETRRPPDEYCPRYATRKPKAYELENEQRILQALDIKQIGAMPEGE